MRRRWAALAALAAMGLAACAGIPTDGPIQYGEREVGSTEPLFPLAEGPRPGDGPTLMVRRFLEAAAAGVASDFSVAREYLTAGANADWNPNARVMVYQTGALTPDLDEDDGVVRYQVPVQAILDDSGRMTEGAEGQRSPYEISIVQNAQGEWRVSGLEDGVLISSNYLQSYFRPVELAFASQDLTTVVPELRWLPTNNAPTLAARELVEGPSAFLADAVVTGFPAGASLEVEAVVVEEGVANVALSPESAGGPAERALAQEQLRVTLTALPTVSEVEVSVGALPIGGDSSVTLARPVVPAAQAAAMVGDRLGLWDGEELWMVPGEQGRLPEGASGVALAYGDERAAFVTGGQLAVTEALTGGVESLAEYDPDAEVGEQVMDLSVVYEGASLVEPTFDRHGWLWSAQSAMPETLVAVSPDGEPVELEARDLPGRSLQSMAVSRGGARIALLSRSGGQQIVEVAGVVRADDGTPLSVSQSLPIGVDIDTATEVIWVDDTTVAVLGSDADGDSPELWLVTVGGTTTQVETVVGVEAMTARYGEQSLTVMSSDGDVRERSGTGWSAIVSGVRELAYAG